VLSATAASVAVAGVATRMTICSHERFCFSAHQTDRSIY